MQPITPAGLRKATIELAAVGVVVLVSTGCGGRMLRGRVLDAQTAKPIAGATVYADWGAPCSVSLRCSSASVWYGSILAVSARAARRRPMLKENSCSIGPRFLSRGQRFSQYTSVATLLRESAPLMPAGPARTRPRPWKCGSIPPPRGLLQAAHRAFPFRNSEPRSPRVRGPAVDGPRVSRWSQRGEGSAEAVRCPSTARRDDLVWPPGDRPRLHAPGAREARRGPVRCRGRSRTPVETTAAISDQGKMPDRARMAPQEAAV